MTEWSYKPNNLIDKVSKPYLDWGEGGSRINPSLSISVSNSLKIKGGYILDRMVLETKPFDTQSSESTLLSM